MQSARPTQAAPVSEPLWLWAWSGACIGYRVGDSLFASDGLELGRFFGTEVYGADGQYLGELSEASDGSRLTTSIYKKSRVKDGFVPTLGRACKRPPNRGTEPLFCGHESFRAPGENRSGIGA